MSSVAQHISSLFLSDFDKSIPENILLLAQKLKSLRAQVELQLTQNEGQKGEHLLGELTKLIADIDQAISSVDVLVNLISTQSDEFKKNFYESAEIKTLDEKIKRYLQQLNFSQAQES